MVIKKSIILVILLQLCFSCKQNNYEIVTEYNSHFQNSTLYLLKNNKKVDSIKVEDYYGSDELEKIQKELWKFSYKKHGGTGVKVKEQIFLSYRNDKLINSFKGISYNIDIELKEDNLGNIFNDTIKYETLDIITKDTSLILKYKLSENGINQQKIKPLYFDQKFRILYTQKQANTYSIQIDSLRYDYKNNNWYAFQLKQLAYLNK